MVKLKKLFNSLQIDSKSVSFTEEKLTDKLLKRLKKSTYKKDKEFVKDFNLLENKEDLFKQKDGYSIPIKAEFIDKSDDIDRSTSFSIKAPFDLLHADIGHLHFLDKSAADPKYCLPLVDLFTSKIYVYVMKSRTRK